MYWNHFHVGYLPNGYGTRETCCPGTGWRFLLCIQLMQLCPGSLQQSAVCHKLGTDGFPFTPNTRFLGGQTEASPRQYRGIFHALSTVFREEGPRALYKGWLPSVIGVVSNPVLVHYLFGLNCSFADQSNLES
ncbi:Mitochondrial adenine nucleotide transporter like [Actinidia chinensis var. chinensis]|uniref:Mitochondrial adenine nucleotide transporter like n=1 Tax=Actinidia chinensis var. chinensis TaxID=1590841 RepID=A0A2R6QN32_ACTCC|nr:Mitochondrial adenine nucleotide transporter like [Actinidia chinensis var. chinensis]